MPFWTAALLFIVCVIGAVIFIKSYRKDKKTYFIILTVIMLLIALGLLVYSALALITLSRESADTSDAIRRIDTYIDDAIDMINYTKRDDFSDVTFSYERKLEYDSLSSEDKAMYDKMLQNAREFSPFSYTASGDGYDVLDRSLSVYGTLIRDHPEVENYFIWHEVLDGDMITTAIEALYFMPWDADQNPADIKELQKEVKRFDAVCDRIAKRMPENLSAYDQYRYLATVISLVTSYDYNYIGGWQIARAYGSIVGGYSVCQGYSRGFMYLCRKADLWCETVEGVAGENDSHMWNIVKLDSGTYFVDITWSDELGVVGSTEWDDYFMLTQEELLKDHEITDGKVATGTQIIT